RVRGSTEDHEVSASVLRPAGLGLLVAERKLLAVADGRDAFAWDPKGDQVVARRGCALGAESEIVLDGAATVAVPLDLDLGLRVLAQPVGIHAQELARIVAQLEGIIGEVDILQGTLLALLAERAALELVQARAGDGALARGGGAFVRGLGFLLAAPRRD